MLFVDVPRQRQTPIYDTAPNAMAGKVNADCAHNRWLSALCPNLVLFVTNSRSFYEWSIVYWWSGDMLAVLCVFVNKTMNTCDLYLLWWAKKQVCPEWCGKRAELMRLLATLHGSPRLRHRAVLGIDQAADVRWQFPIVKIGKQKARKPPLPLARRGPPI